MFTGIIYIISSSTVSYTHNYMYMYMYMCVYPAVKKHVQPTSQSVS